MPAVGSSGYCNLGSTEGIEEGRQVLPREDKGTGDGEQLDKGTRYGERDLHLGNKGGGRGYMLSLIHI